MTFQTTLDYLLAPPKPSDYTICSRCPLPIERGRYSGDLCPDCQLSSKHVAKQQRQRGAKHDSAPEFEVTIHYSTSRYAHSSYPARMSVNHAGFTYLLCVVEDDPVAHHYVTDVLGHHQWPVVTVTSYGRLLAHWEGAEAGYFPNRYSQLPLLHRQVQSNTAKPLSDARPYA